MKCFFKINIKVLLLQKRLKSFKMSKNQERINNATDKVVDYMYKNEEKHFRENLTDDDLKNSEGFLKKLKDHIFYSVMVLIHKGDAKTINVWLNEYWEECGGEEYEDDEDDEDTEIINCECPFPKFVIRDGIQFCRACELPDHYKNGVVADWSDNEDYESTTEFARNKPCECGCGLLGGTCEKQTKKYEIENQDNEDTESVESHDDYDDHGVLCHYSRTTGGWEEIEP